MRVTFPAALPRLFIGYRLALGVGFIVTVAVEMVAGKHGLGGFLWHSWQILRIEEVYVGLMVIGLLGILGALWAGSTRGSADAMASRSVTIEGAAVMARRQASWRALLSPLIVVLV